MSNEKHNFELTFPHNVSKFAFPPTEKQKAAVSQFSSPYPDNLRCFVNKYNEEGKKILLVVDDFITQSTNYKGDPEESDLDRNCIFSGKEGSGLQNIIAHAVGKISNKIQLKQIVVFNWCFTNFHFPLNSKKGEHIKSITIANGVFYDRLLDFIKHYKPDAVFISGVLVWEYFNAKMQNDTITNQRMLMGRVMRGHVDLPQTKWLLKLNNRRLKHVNRHYFNIMGCVDCKKLVAWDVSATKHPNLIGYWSDCFTQLINGRNRYKINLPRGIKFINVNKIEKFNKLIRELWKQKIVSIDTETEDLGRIKNTLYTIQFCYDGQIGYTIPVDHPDTPYTTQQRKYIKEKLKEYFEYGKSLYHIYQNGKFDIPVLFACCGVRFYNHRVYDIQSGEYALDENIKLLSLWNVKNDKKRKLSPYALDFIAERYGCSVYRFIEFSKGNRGSIGKEGLTKRFIQYCGYDVIVPFHIHLYQIAEAKRRKHSKFLKFVCEQLSDTILVCGQIEHTGHLIDKIALFELKSRDGAIAQETREVLAEFKKSKACCKVNEYLMKKEGIPQGKGFFGKQVWLFDIKKTEHKQLLFFKALKLNPLAYMKDVGQRVGYGKVDKKFKKTYKDVPEIQIFQQYEDLTHFSDNFITPIYDKLTTNRDSLYDGRLRATYDFIRVSTGRLSSFDPNLQNIPARGTLSKKVKRIFIAKPDNILVEMDYCLTGDNLIPTENGLLRIDEIVKHNKKTLFTFKRDINLVVGGIADPAQAKKWVYVGKKPTITITTQSNNNISCTREHKLLVLDEFIGRLIWKKAGDCVLGDLLVINPKQITRKTLLPLNLTDQTFINSNNTSGETNVYFDKMAVSRPWYCRIKVRGQKGKYTRVGAFKTREEAIVARNKALLQNNHASNLSFKILNKPNYMTPALAFIIGSLAAEGHFSQHRRYNDVRFSNSDKSYLKKYQDCVEEVFGFRPKFELQIKAGTKTIINGIKTICHNDHYIIRITSTQVAKWMKELGLYHQHGLRKGKKPSHYKHVPWSILQADEESQYAFLAAYLEGDGHINNDMHNISWYSSSLALLNQIRVILNSHGYFTYKSKNATAHAISLGTQSSQKLWKKLEPYMATKQLLSYKGRDYYGIPIKYWKKFENRNIYNNKKLMYDNSSAYMNKLKNKNRREYEYLSELLDKKYHYVPITKIEDNGIKPVYDLTMQKGVEEAFIANGLVVHNSAHEVKDLANESKDEVLLTSFYAGLEYRSNLRILAYKYAENLEEWLALAKRVQWNDKDKITDKPVLSFEQKVEVVRSINNPITREIGQIVLDIEAKGDIHKLNAVRFFDVENALLVTGDQRYEIKAVVFGVIYGKGKTGLAKPKAEGGLGKDEDYCQSLIDKFYTEFLGAANYISDTSAYGRANLCVESPLGMIRHLPAYLHSRPAMQNAMDRRATNSIIQGVASCMGITAARNLQKLIWHLFIKQGANFPWKTLVNDVHDSLKSEVPIHLVPIYVYLLESASTTLVHKRYKEVFGYELSIGLEMEFGIGASQDRVKTWDFTHKTMYDKLEEEMEWQNKELGYNNNITKQMKRVKHNWGIIRKLRLQELEQSVQSRNPAMHMILNEKNSMKMGFII